MIEMQPLKTFSVLLIPLKYLTHSHSQKHTNSDQNLYFAEINHVKTSKFLGELDESHDDVTMVGIIKHSYEMALIKFTEFHLNL